MILIDSSAWVEFLRATGSRTHRRVVDAMHGEIATTDAVMMEVLAGARDEGHLHDLRRLLARATHLRTESQDFEQAAALYRACSRQGETVRRLLDCLIAAVAIRHNVVVLHLDADLEVLARHTALQTEAS